MNRLEACFLAPCTRLISLLIATAVSHAVPEIVPHENPGQGEVFDGQIRPLLKEYCLTCHSTEEQKGDLDLETFSSLEAVKKHPKVWQSVVEQLANGEMPPKKKPQPSPEEKDRLAKWVMATLDEIAQARAGDPGPVVLRRLSNAEYTYTLQDLTGVESLQPAREFPIDGAAGEGFTNTGQALVMSPSLITKYLDAGKEVAKHAVLLPDGLRFSSKTTQRDWTEEIVADIRAFYRRFTDPSSREKLTLQGVALDTNEAGSLPLEKYLAASIERRDGVASNPALSAKYLSTLTAALADTRPSLLLDRVRERWRTAKPGDVAELASKITPWQKALWKFSSVGHIGRVGGPKAWMEPVNPLAPNVEMRLKIPAPQDGREVTLYLVASDAGDGSDHDSVVWQRPRLVAPGRPDLLLRDVQAVSAGLALRRERIFGGAAKALAAANEASASQGKSDVAELGSRYGVEPEALTGWLAYLGIGGSAEIDSRFTTTIPKHGNYDFVKGWGSAETPYLLTNASGEDVRIPGNMKAGSVAVHPSPKLSVGAGWSSPVAASMRVDAVVNHAHPGCGNGVVWSLELRRDGTRQRLASGAVGVAQDAKVGPIENVAVQPGDLISLLIGPRDGEHSCDLTAVDLTLASSGEGARTWNLAADIAKDVLAGNPHSDSFGNTGVWHFYSEPVSGAPGTVIPAGSVLARWQSASTEEEKNALAGELQKLLLAGTPPAADGPDAQLYRELSSVGGPLFRTAGSHESSGSPDIAMLAPAVLEVRIPAELAAGCEFVTTGTLDPASGAEGSVQLQVLTTKPEPVAGLIPSSTTVANAEVVMLANNQRVSYGMPIIVNDASAARRRIEGAFEEFRQLFPAALCYTKIVPVDEVVTLTLIHRDDEHLARLMLDDAQTAKLDRMWDELRYVSQDALMLVDAFTQLLEYASQDGDPKQFEPMRDSINERAAALRQRLVDTEPKHVDAVLRFADRAYRRPLTDSEGAELRGLYHKLREQELPHEDAIRLTLARVLVAPKFLYRAETPAPGLVQTPINDWELANRLSYFLWASMPDTELREAAAAGTLRDPGILAVQLRRMLADERVRRLSTEFACQWLHIRDFDTLDEKSERHFPGFGELRAPMYEESIRFFTDFFQHDRSVLSILDADHTFLNEALAKHYGIPGISGDEWRRVDGMKKAGRGGILGQAAPLAKQSGASRTSPILRGNWIAEVLLGDKLPRPPKDVPQLPEDEAIEALTVRELTEKHTSDPSCYGCHQRIDAFGFALESFDAVGRRRERDLGDRVIDTRAKVMDGTEIDGLNGLRDYLLTTRRDVFLRQFCRKLLGYALGRGVQLSDEPLLTEMRAQLMAKDTHISVAIDAIVRSRQFLEIRGREMAYDD